MPEKNIFVGNVSRETYYSPRRKIFFMNNMIRMFHVKHCCCVNSMTRCCLELTF